VGAAAALSVAAGLIHASVTVVHFREFWLFGLFFAIAAPLQVVWGEMVRRRPWDRRLLLAGAGANVAVALLWLVSRTVGLPIGPEAGEVEGVGLKDVLATADELALALVVALVLAGARGRAIAPAAWTLAAVSGIAALLGGGH
jgi:hypothetical protein